MDTVSTSELESAKKRFIITHTEAADTGIRLFKIEDIRTGVIITFAEFNKDFDVHLAVAWAGAQTSRSKDDYELIFRKIVKMLENDPNFVKQKVEKFGIGYNHASILGMLPVFLYINKIPVMQAFWMFNHTSVGDGQESSTRYILDFMDDSTAPDILNKLDLQRLPEDLRKEIIEEWNSLMQLALANYQKWYQKIEVAYEKKFVEKGIPVSKATMTARVLDIARMFLPGGALTSMCELGNVRMVRDFIIQLQETEIPEYVALAEQLLQSLTLEDTEEAHDIQAHLSGMVKYTEPQFIIRDNLNDLEGLLKQHAGFNALLEGNLGERKGSYVNESVVTRIEYGETVQVGSLLAMQYILVLFPNLDPVRILDWLATLKPDEKRAIGKIILNGHDHHHQMRNEGDIRGPDVYIMETALAYLRDIGRHKAEGRQVWLLDSKKYVDMAANGFNMNMQIMRTDGLTHLIPEWQADGQEYYERYNRLARKLNEYYEQGELECLRDGYLLGHQTQLQISGPLTQLLYMISQRAAGGTDYGYKDIVIRVANMIRGDEFLEDFLPNVQELLDLDDPIEFNKRN